MLRPYGKTVLATVYKEEENDVKPIIIVQKQEKDFKTLQVQSIGDIVNINLGDKIIVNRYAGRRFDYKDIEYIVIDEKEILAIF